MTFREENPYRVELSGPADAQDGSCMLCRVRLDGSERRRKVYTLSLVMSNGRSTWRLCRDHIKEVRAALRGTIA